MAFHAEGLTASTQNDKIAIEGSDNCDQLVCCFLCGIYYDLFSARLRRLMTGVLSVPIGQMASDNTSAILATVTIISPILQENLDVSGQPKSKMT